MNSGSDYGKSILARAYWEWVRSTEELVIGPTRSAFEKPKKFPNGIYIFIAEDPEPETLPLEKRMILRPCGAASIVTPDGIRYRFVNKIGGDPRP